MYPVDDAEYPDCTSPGPATRTSGRCPTWRRPRRWRSSPSVAVTRTGPASRTRWTVWSGDWSARASRRWDSPLGRGRPGWHIECTAIALQPAGSDFDVQAGGSDLIFPHHEMCAAGGAGGHRRSRSPRPTSHSGMVGLDGEKMSQVQGQPGAGLEAAGGRRRPDGDPAGPALPPLPRRLDVDRRRAGRGRRAPGHAGARPCGSTPA